MHDLSNVTVLPINEEVSMCDLNLFVVNTNGTIENMLRNVSVEIT